MARYDRIALLEAPPRDQVFPAWGVLRDLEGRERDGDLARRARLRYLALRPVRRLLDVGSAHVGQESYLSLVEAAREELGYLPARDGERARLARYLHRIEDRDPARIVAAALEVGRACIAAGQPYGAEEFALTAHGIAASGGHDELAGAASALLAQICRVQQRLHDAEAWATRATALADRTGQRAYRVRAQAELAFAAAARGERSRAIATLQTELEAARSAADRNAEALTLAQLCACELMFGNAAAALEFAWPALRDLDDVRDRSRLLEDAGTAFAAAGLHTAAERCFTLLARRGSEPAMSARARAAQAVQAAASGSTVTFRDRRAALLGDDGEWAAEPRANAFVHLELGRGCVLVRDYDFAREHLRTAISTARQHSLADMLGSAEGVLSLLESDSAAGLPPTAAPPASARRIADQLESLPDFASVPG